MGLKKMYCLLEIVIVFVEIQHFVMKRRDSSVSRHFMHATYYSKNDRLRLTLLFFVGFFLLVFRHKVYGQHGGIGFQKTNLLLVERPQFVVKEIQDWILKNVKSSILIVSVPSATQTFTQNTAYHAQSKFTNINILHSYFIPT